MANISLSNRDKLLTICSMVFFCVLLTLYINLYQKQDLVYTHLYYVPIILAGIWYQFSSLYLAVGMGLFHIAINYAVFDSITPSSVYRAILFMMTACIISYISRATIHKTAASSNPVPALSSDSRQYQIDMAGKIAVELGHEIRNPLTTVRGFLQFLNNDDPKPGNQEYYDLMIEELDKANEVISHLINLSGNKISNQNLYDLNTILRDLLPTLIHAAQSQKVKIQTQLEDLTPLVVDSQEINILILNLVVNGIEAMPQGGTVTVSTKMKNGSIFLEVCDQGPGIPVDIAKHIGTPFFSTKDSSRGLGLATCWSIASRNNARLDFFSTSNGTTFITEFFAS